MKSSLTIAAFMLALAVQVPARAGGYFQRIPEVGEWAQYDMTFTESHKSNDGEEFNELFTIEGTLTLKCVGEETVDGEHCLWIETRLEVSPPPQAGADAPGRTIIVKLLVPEDHIVDGDLYDHFLRGWWQTEDEVNPLSNEATRFADADQQPWAAILIALCATQDAVGTRESITIDLDGVEHEFDRAESGAFRDRELLDATITGEGIWWSAEDRAFGVAASRITWLTNFSDDDSAHRIEAEARLAATGTDATSDLPENN